MLLLFLFHHRIYLSARFLRERDRKVILCHCKVTIYQTKVKKADSRFQRSTIGAMDVTRCGLPMKHCQIPTNGKYTFRLIAHSLTKMSDLSPPTMDNVSLSLDWSAVKISININVRAQSPRSLEECLQDVVFQNLFPGWCTHRSFSAPAYVNHLCR